MDTIAASCATEAADGSGRGSWWLLAGYADGESGQAGRLQDRAAPHWAAIRNAHVARPTRGLLAF